MDIARCELALLYPDNMINNHTDIQKRLDGNKAIVTIIALELCARKDVSLFDERELVLGEFTT